MGIKTLFQLTAFDGEKKIGQFVLCRQHCDSTKNSYSQDRPHNIAVFIDKLVDNPNDYTEGDYCESCELFQDNKTYEGDSNRERWKEWANGQAHEDGSTPLEWVEINYGEDYKDGYSSEVSESFANHYLEANKT